MTNKEIVDIYINNGLIQRCVDCQFANLKDKQFRNDWLSDLVCILYEYDNDKLLDAHLNNHFNALVTAICIRNLWSHTSPYYKQYKKFMDKSDDITEEMIDTIPDE